MENQPTPPLNLPDSAPALALRLGLILAGVVALVARRFLRMPHLMRFTILLCARLGRAARRFARVMTQPPQARPARTQQKRTNPDRVRPVALPRGNAWLVRALGYEAAGLGSQLQALLAEPEMQALLTELPAAGRILRPICRMLGVSAALPAPLLAGPSDDPIVAPRVHQTKPCPHLAAGGSVGISAECARLLASV